MDVWYILRRTCGFITTVYNFLRDYQLNEGVEVDLHH